MKNLKTKLEVVSTSDMSPSSRLHRDRVHEGATRSENVSEALTGKMGPNSSSEETTFENEPDQVPGLEKSEGEPEPSAVPLVVEHTSEESSDEENRMDTINDYNDVVK